MIINAARDVKRGNPRQLSFCPSRPEIIIIIRRVGGCAGLIETNTKKKKNRSVALMDAYGNTHYVQSRCTVVVRMMNRPPAPRTERTVKPGGETELYTHCTISILY